MSSEDLDSSVGQLGFCFVCKVHHEGTFVCKGVTADKGKVGTVWTKGPAWLFWSPWLFLSFLAGRVIFERPGQDEQDFRAPSC